MVSLKSCGLFISTKLRYCIWFRLSSVFLVQSIRGWDKTKTAD
jgi:hypothetical protein